MSRAALYTKGGGGLVRSGHSGWTADDAPRMLAADITTDAPILNTVDYVNAHLTMRYDSGAGPVALDIDAQMRGRGNTTWSAPKKPYKVKLLSGQSKPLFGNATSRDWALLQNYSDRSLIRTACVYEMARRATGRWAPHSVFTEVTMNGTFDGLYQFIETIDVQPGRVAIRKMKDTDTTGLAVTGPYMLETDEAEYHFRTSRQTPVQYDTPDVVGTVGEAAQSAYIVPWIEDFETRLVTGGDWMSLADIPSWVDWYLLQELTRNADSQWYKSCKFYKEQDTESAAGKVVLWPPWDFDLSMATYEMNPEGWWTRSGPNTANGGTRPNWLYYACQTPAFIEACRARWDEAWVPAVETMPAYMVALGEELAEPRERDRVRWGGEAQLTFRNDPVQMAAWLTTRAAWIDANL